MRILIAGFLFFAVYALIGRWYFVCEVRNRCGEPEAIPFLAGNLMVTQGGVAVLEGYAQIYYPKDSIRTRFNQRFFLDLASYLNEHPSLGLSITGRYLTSEEGSPSGFFHNIGLARAARAGLELEERGIDPKRIKLGFERIDQDTLTEPFLFELLP